MGIRTAEIKEAHAIAAIINAAFRVEQFFIDGDRITVQQVREFFDKGAFLVTGENGTMSGCVYIETRGSRAYLGLLSVDPSLQGSGIGRLLVAAAEEHAREKGCGHMDLRIVNVREELPAFYQRLGYRESGTEPFPSDPPTKIPCHFVNMTKELGTRGE